jgi:cold shock CspA family protein/CRISPR/Cas system CSM-associated protein Csm3 (group 7 of RAMP superfamily)
MTHSFLNPYHFVPTQPPLTPEGWRGTLHKTGGKDFGLTKDTKIDGHAVYAADGHSGRITCTLKLETPTVIGAERLEGGKNPAVYGVVIPCLFKGKPAVPSASLKGLLSSVIEAASRSAYRVLVDKRLTVSPAQNVRHTQGEGTAKIGTVHTYFPEKSRPISGASKTVSMADGLLGFVRVKGSTGDITGLEARAGKIRISHAVLAGDWVSKGEDELFIEGDFDQKPFGRNWSATRLKEQGSPMKKPGNHNKLNSATPNFYFKKVGAETAYISKQDFGTNPPGDYAPMGRKFYLHHVGGTGGFSEPWKTRVPLEFDTAKARKAAVRPLKKGVTFAFYIDYDNLKPEELDLLCFALHPSERFRHKIATGRGLGLGSIHITPVGIEPIDRQKRYTGDGDPFTAKRSRIKDRTAVSGSLAECVKLHSETHREWLEKNDPAALTALLAIGECHNFDDRSVPVSPPVLWVPLTEVKYGAALTGAATSEDRSYLWFQKNDTGRQQAFPPISATTGIPVLLSNRDGETPDRAAAPQLTFRGEVDYYDPTRDHGVIYDNEGKAEITFTSRIVNAPNPRTLRQGDRVSGTMQKQADGGFEALSVTPG